MLAFKTWKQSITGKFLIKKGLSEENLKKQFNLNKEFWSNQI